jgi:CIC family chloride channel protein
VSFFLSSRLQKEPIYEALAVQDGIHLPGGALGERRQSQRQVAELMRPAANWIAVDMPLAKAVEEARDKEFRTFLAGNGKRLIGVVTLEQIAQTLAKGQGAEAKSVGNLIDGKQAVDFPHVHADQALYVALERMGAGGLDLLPVVSRADAHQVLGIIAQADVLASYGVPR